MAKRPQTTLPPPLLKKAKPGPKEERLIIDNPEAALDALLKKKAAK